jgi:hypothetical protein
VTWENVTTFEDQMRKDIPIGTPANDVMDLLETLGDQARIPPARQNAAQEYDNACT